MAAQKHTDYTFRWISKISEVDKAAWNELAEPLPTPILDWEWLHQMEVSGSTVPSTGWRPSHLTVWKGDELVAAAPLYIKTSSSGEFVYDYAWADVARQVGVRYYPKLVGMSPATPSIGYRFLVSASEDLDAMTEIMLDEIDDFCDSRRLGSVGFNFADPDWAEIVSRHGYRKWMHQSYAWKNKGYGSFDDYLALFNKNQRRNVKRERKSIEEAGIVLKPLVGEEIPKSYFAHMYQFYDIQNSQFGPWAARYLTREFFLGLYEGFRHRLMFMAAFEESDLDTPVGMAFLLTKGDQLIGRYWGCTANYSNLYFNTCYYAPIQWAIEHGVKVFDPGAGSPLKLRRGFEAVGNFSLHKFYDRQMQKIMDAYIDEINANEELQIEAMNGAVPFVEERLREREEKSES